MEPAADAPHCSRHPQWQAARTCARCGDYVCIYCLGDLGHHDESAELCRACSQRSHDGRRRRGRIKMLVAIAALVLSDVVVITLHAFTQGSGELAIGLVRLLLTCGLSYLIYRGADWARWLAIVLLTLGCVGSLQVHHPATLVLAAVLVAAIVLLLDKDTKFFLDTQADERTRAE